MVPELAFCTNCTAFTAALKVVVPVLVREMLPRPWEPPTAPVNVIFLNPVATVKLRAVASALFKVLVKLILLLVLVVTPVKLLLLFVVAKETAEFKTVGPV